MNGNEYAWTVLSRHELRLESLLDVAHRQETVWLEFKADPFCHLDAEKVPFDDVIWHTIKAVIAMINTRGGCIVFGVEDKTLEYVQLKYKNGDVVVDFDKFHRQLESGFLSKKQLNLHGKQWGGCDGDGESLICSVTFSTSVSDYCTFRSGVTYGGRPVSVLLVRPSADKDYIYVTARTESKSDMLRGKPNVVPKRRLYVRRSGDMGATKCLSIDDEESDSSWERPRLDFDDWFREKKFDNMLSPVAKFVGRETILLKLEKLLNTFDRWRIPLLYGVPGIGKSQIAFQYAKTHGMNYDSLVYVEASRFGTFVDMGAYLAKNPDFRREFLLGTDREEQSLQLSGELFMSVKMAIASKRLGRVLLVVDNVCHPNVMRPALLRRYLGEKYDIDHLHVIFTSRSPRLCFEGDDIVEPIEVTPLSEEDGFKLLSVKARPENVEEANAAKKIVRYCGGNPWALDLVGEYLCQNICRKGMNGYQLCQNLLCSELHGVFPPRDGKSERIGNATEVIGVRELIEPTVRELFPEELDVCLLLTTDGECSALEEPLRRAYEYLIGGHVDEHEWIWICESLKAKMVLREKINDQGMVVFEFRDPLLARGFSDWERPIGVSDAYLEYLRYRCRYGSDRPNSDASKMWRYLRQCEANRDHVISVLFDADRFGWPLGFLGIDTVSRVRNVESGFTWKDVLAICQMVEDDSRYAADLSEIRSLEDVDVSDEERWKKYDLPILAMRKKVYCDDPCMLGRSYLHTARQSLGRSVPYQDVEDLLRHALEYLPSQNDGCRRYRLDALDQLAYCADLERENRDDIGDDESEKLRDQVRFCLKEIRRFDPDRYSNQNVYPDDLDECIFEGRYPRGN